MADESCVLQVVERAKAEDLNRQVRYTVAFVRNREGKVITDVRIHPSLPFVILFSYTFALHFHVLLRILRQQMTSRDLLSEVAGITTPGIRCR